MQIHQTLIHILESYQSNSKIGLCVSRIAWPVQTQEIKKT